MAVHAGKLMFTRIDFRGLRPALAAVLLASSAFAAWAQDASSILHGQEIRELEGQDVDANAALLEALRRAARQGPKFTLSTERIVLGFEAAGSDAETLRITNTGDELGVVQGVNSVGFFDGLEIDNACDGSLEPGAFCDVEISFASDTPRVVQTAIVGTINERGRTSFSVPIEIAVTAPPEPEPEPEPVVETPEPVVVIQAPPTPKGPTSEDIARRYFGAVGGLSGPAPERGFTVVSAPEPAKVAGQRGGSIAVERVTADPRYDPSIPYTEASLPVDRDMILTPDRVIKAVLETPISNVMCGKVVATIESDVYSATSRRPLIPAGSRAIGSCGEFVVERVAISWDRIITTDGRSISFNDSLTETRDAGGLGGGLGRIYQSPTDKYVLPIVSTMVDSIAGLIYANYGEDEDVVTDPNTGAVTKSNSARNEGLRIVTGEARETAQQMITDIRDVRKIAVVPAGSRIDIEIREDIYFKSDREVVRLADMTYDIEIPEEQPSVEQDPQPRIVLVPWTEGATGSVVVVGGRRYVVQDAPVLNEDGRPVPPAQPGSVEATLQDISAAPSAQGVVGQRTPPVSEIP